LCRRFCQGESIHGIPNGVELDYFDQLTGVDGSDSGPPECTFVGALDYRANIEGITWFCRNVWPEVCRIQANARLTLVGRNPVASIQQLASLPGVEVAGDVPDVRPYLSRATVIVVPLRVARGIQNKILEALAARKAVIASGPALEGLDVEPGLHACQADSIGDWLESILRLFDDANLRRRLASAGRAFVEEHHSWDARLEPLERLLGIHAALPVIARSP
jgi:glycosyltransferase involved in cell wall biosynthesis